MNKNYKTAFVFLSNYYDSRQNIYLSRVTYVQPKKLRRLPFSLYFFCGFLFTSHSLISKSRSIASCWVEGSLVDKRCSPGKGFFTFRHTVQSCTLFLIYLQGLYSKELCKDWIVLKVWWQDATPLCLFFIFYNIHTFQSHSYNTFIRRHLPRPLSISSSLESSVGKISLWCRAENRTWALPSTASRRATNCAMPHHSEPRRTITEPRCTILSHAAPYWDTPHYLAKVFFTFWHTVQNCKLFLIYLQGLYAVELCKGWIVHR